MFQNCLVMELIREIVVALSVEFHYVQYLILDGIERRMKPVQQLKNHLVELSSFIMVTLVIPWMSPLICGGFLLCMFKEGVKVSRRWILKRPWLLLDRFPGPRSYPGVGTLTMDMVFTNFWNWSVKLCRRWNGEPVRLWRFGRGTLLVSSYRYAEQLFRRGDFNGKMEDLKIIRRQRGGAALGVLEGEEFGKRKRLVERGFEEEVVKARIPLFLEEAERMKKRLEGYVGEEVDVVNEVMLGVFRVMERSGLGDQGNCKLGQEEDLDVVVRHMKAVQIITKNLSTRILGPYLWQRNDFFYYNFTKEGIAVKVATDLINAVVLEVVKMERNRRLSLVPRDHAEHTSDPHHPCYLDILLDHQDKGQLTQDEVISELHSFMCGGFESTALAICWTLLLLALHPNHQQRCFEELCENNDEGVPNSNCPSCTMNSPHLDLCLKESLRLFPPVPLFPRRTTRDVVLEDGRVIPAEVDVLIFAHLIHRQPEYFPQPEKFIPERHWGKTSPALLPFAGGVRPCLGETWGMCLTKVVLAQLILGFEWAAPPGLDQLDQVKTAYHGLLYPKQGIRLNIRKREGRQMILVD